LGIDLPASFYYELKSIDPYLFPVWHQYSLLWDSIINSYEGPLEDPRYVVKYEYGHLNPGFVLTDGSGEPVQEGKWHLYRWCYPHGIAHVINIDSKDREYLNLLARRLWLQASYNDKFGFRGYQKLLEQKDADERQKQMDDKQDLMNEISKTNSAMLGRAAANYARGIAKATNPTKEIITSYGRQSNKSKIVRPITDREGGLILPDGMGEEW
jgi:hypothetical protein